MCVNNRCVTFKYYLVMYDPVLVIIIIIVPCYLSRSKGFFYHGITKILLLIGSFAGISKDVYIAVHVRIDCGI